MGLRVDFALEDLRGAEDRQAGDRGAEFLARLVAGLGDLRLGRRNLALALAGRFFPRLVHDLRLALRGLIDDFTCLVARLGDLPIHFGFGRLQLFLGAVGRSEALGDALAARDWAVANHPRVDPDRVGILGWSHGGLISLLAVFDHPEKFKVAYAGVPVSDLIARMGYQTQGYRDLYSADYHIGKTAHEDLEEYRRRSPAWQAHKLQTPLLIHTNTNDDDVNVLEVEHLIKALKAENKKFEYEIYQDIPGGHSFDRMDTKIAHEIRVKIYKFLAAELNPPDPINDVGSLKKAAYRY